MTIQQLRADLAEQTAIDAYRALSQLRPIVQSVADYDRSVRRLDAILRRRSV